ncbi:MAG: sugar phosphate isomerase/epimerase [Candidatus Peribacteraceae bacterium]|nr:sugar phosphate isomerase/epimerase [Candidatus Peribacteraceae bacterium]
MAREVTLFTGQWGDVPLPELAEKAKTLGFDGLELACWGVGGGHFDIAEAVGPKGEEYLKKRWELLQRHGLVSRAISNHLVGQGICDLIDERHKEILPPDVWGDGDPEEVRKGCAERMRLAATAMRYFYEAAPKDVKASWPLMDPETDTPRLVVNGFTGSSIWHALYAFPPTSQEYLDRGFEDFGRRFGPILDHFDKMDVYFALEVHPTEIAFDIASAERALEAVNNHPRFGFNYDPSHLAYQGVDYIKFIRRFGKRIFHVHMKDAWWGHGDGTVGVFGGHTSFGDPRRYWDFRSLGRGDIRFEDIIAALNDVGYNGPLSVEWEDGRMNREHGAAEACAFVRKVDFVRNLQAFDAAFAKKD